MVFSQERKTGGLLVELDGKRFVIDPGPGSLVHLQSLKLKPEKLDFILLSHMHVDHSNDINILLDGIENPVLITEEHCVRKKPDFDEHPHVSKFHQKRTKIHVVNENDKLNIDGIEITATKTNHSCPGVGFVIKGSKTIGYPSDGLYFKGQERYFEDCDVLVLNTTLPKGHETINKHMTVDDAILLLKAISRKPKLSVITHLSTIMVRSNLWRQIKIIQESTGANTIFAEDFLELDMDNLKSAVLKPQV